MALVRGETASYRRFTWMGSDKSVTSFENTTLMRDGGDNNPGSPLKRRTREQRTRVIREFRCYLDHLRKDILQNDDDAELTGMPKSSYKREEPHKEQEKVSMNLSCLVRGSRYRSGDGFVSRYDGTNYGSVATLVDYNAHCHTILTDLVEDKKATLSKKKASGIHLTQQEAVALKEAESIELPTEGGTQIAPDSESALVSAKKLLQYTLVRTANLYGSYREIILSPPAESANKVDATDQEKLATPPNEEEKKQEETADGGECGW